VALLRNVCVSIQPIKAAAQTRDLLTFLMHVGGAVGHFVHGAIALPIIPAIPDACWRTSKRVDDVPAYMTDDGH